MALSDPFDTTYAGAYKAGSSLGEGISSAVGDVTNAESQKNLLKSMGIVQTTQKPLTSADYEQAAKDYAAKTGHQINFKMASGLDEPTKLQFLDKTFDNYGIPKPQPKSVTTVDYSKISNLPIGMKMPLPGGASYESPQMNPTMMALGMMGLNSRNPSAGVSNQSQGQPTTDQSGQSIPNQSNQTAPAQQQTYQGGTPGVLSAPSPKTPEEKEAALNALPPLVGNNVRLMLDDKLTARDISGMNSQTKGVYTAIAQHIDPNYDPTQVPARIALRKDFQSGATSKTLTSLNTAIHHADVAYDQVQGLDNGPIKKANGFGNFIKSETGDPRVDVLRTTLSFLNRETPKAIAAGVVTNEDKQAFDQNLNIAQSKEVASKVIDDYITLLGGRLQPKIEQWQNTFGDTSSFPAMGKSTIAILNKHGFNYDPATGSLEKGQPGQQQAAQPQFSPEEIQAELQRRQQSRGQ